MEDIEVINNVLRLENVSASASVDYKHELEAAGLVLNVDFEWRWYRYNGLNTNYPPVVEFKFKNPALATFYKLRWE